MRKKLKRKPTVYLGCALTHAPKLFLKDIEYLRREISPYVTVLDFLGLHHPSAGEVFQYDTNCVRRCDLFIANVTYPSLGLGVEFGVAVEHRKPIITIAEEKAIVSRFVFGYNDPYHYSLRYKDIKQASRFVIKKIKELFSQD